jgi:hypothetical protein
MGLGEFVSPVGSLPESHHTGRIGICGVRYGETHSGTRAAKSLVGTGVVCTRNCS